MQTYISDNFNLSELECQYFDICRDYRPSHQVKGEHRVCKYDYPCELRQWFKQVIEPYMPHQNLEMQVKLILDKDGKKKKPRQKEEKE